MRARRRKLQRGAKLIMLACIAVAVIWRATKEDRVSDGESYYYESNQAVRLLCILALSGILVTYVMMNRDPRFKTNPWNLPLLSQLNRILLPVVSSFLRFSFMYIYSYRITAAVYAPQPQPTSSWPMSIPPFLYQPEMFGNEFSILTYVHCISSLYLPPIT